MWLWRAVESSVAFRVADYFDGLLYSHASELETSVPGVPPTLRILATRLACSGSNPYILVMNLPRSGFWWDA